MGWLGDLTMNGQMGETKITHRGVTYVSNPLNRVTVFQIPVSLCYQRQRFQIFELKIVF
jgi:hypothetical protein